MTSLVLTKFVYLFAVLIPRQPGSSGKASLMITAVIFAFAPQLTAQDGIEFFEKRIRPVLVERCYECHNSTDSDDGGLILDHRQGLLDGGDTGPAIVRGKPDESLLMKAIRHQLDDLRMPKNNARLDKAVVDDFAKWIRMGAPDPRDQPPSANELAKAISWETIRDQRKKWWSFQPIQDPAPPKLPQGHHVSHPVDRFIAAKLIENKLKPAGSVDRRTAIRRLSYVLTGLPPTPKQIEQFVNDPAANAYGKLVDRLLDSPQFGEKWARHWMDWFRYAESHGSEGDPLIPFAWRYRDYLIRGLNADVAYNQLVKEHIAGDLIAEPRLNRALGINESKIGLGHYRFVEHGYGPTDALDEQVRFTDNQIDVISKAFLGLTVSCARCHDHKFDPVSQKDFYALYGIMTSCRPALVTVSTDDSLETNRNELISLKAKIRSQLADIWRDKLDSLREQLAKLPAPSAANVRSDKDAQKGLTSLQRQVNQSLGDPLSPLYVLAKYRDPAAETKDHLWKKIVDEFRRSQESMKLRRSTNYQVHWSLHGDDEKSWIKQGIGLAGDSTRPGQFQVALSGDHVLANIFPGGVYSHLLSTRHNGVLTSPSFDVKTDEIWVRVAGRNGSRVRYAVQNIPRVAGPVYKANGLNHDELRWVRWDMRYWEGDRVYLEIATANDIPVEARNNERSWFGISEAVAVHENQPRPKNEMVEFVAPLFEAVETAPESVDQLIDAYLRAIESCIVAWQKDSMTDAQANFLAFFVRQGFLLNDMKKLDGLAPLVEQYRQLEQKVVVPVRAPGIIEAEPADHPLFVRGNHKIPGRKLVPRRYLEAFDDSPFDKNQSGRLQLAERMASDDNPLTARVMVNRIWHHVFGQGIVATTDNFGLLGAKPTHPQLLDYLASRFRAEEYSIKKTIRLLVTSETFLRDSTPPQNVAELDPQNRWLSHMRVRRLEAEAIRDSMFMISGRLDPKMFGPPIGDNEPRRSVYVRVKRNNLHPFLAVFDAPAPFSAKGRRDSTNVPGQSLAMLNDPFVHDLARTWVDQVLRDSTLTSDRERVERMFETALGRLPTDREAEHSIAFIEATRQINKESVAKLKLLHDRIKRLEKEIAEIIEPVRKKIQAKRKLNKDTTHKPGPRPIARWDFDNGLKDSIGNLHGKAVDNAKVIDGKLVLDGKSFVMTEPLKQDLTAKTLEAWITLANMNQQGGGAMTLQTLDGHQFDSIVYAERQKRRWMPGSDSFARTQDVGGTNESDDAMKTPIHVAIVYAADGTITCYRNGEPYGKPYRKPGPLKFSAGKSQVLFGLRHGTPGARTTHLSGAIHAARLYDRGLTAEEVRATSSGDPNFVSRREVMEKLSQSQRANLKLFEAEFKTKTQQLAALRKDGAPDVNGHWHEFGKAIFNFKEFIYLR